MNDEVKRIYKPLNDLWGYPQLYKGLKFYPIKIKDSDALEWFNKIFQYPKDYVPEKTILKMSYLKYLLFAVQYSIDTNGNQIQSWLTELLKYVTKSENISFRLTTLNIPVDDIIQKTGIILKINDIEFNEQEFDVIRAIILEQNGLSVEYIEEFNPQLEEYLSFLNRKFSDVTFEDEIFVFCCLMGKTVNELENYTLYQFRKHLDRLMMTFNYQIYSPLEISGQIKAKNGGEIVKHYLAHIDRKSRYSEVLIEKDMFMSNHKEFEDGHVNIPGSSEA